MNRHDKLMNRTCDIIEAGGVIIIKSGSWYLHQHSCIQAGFDSWVWGIRAAAMHFDSLDLAHLIARQFQFKVVVYYSRGALT